MTIEDRVSDFAGVVGIGSSDDLDGVNLVMRLYVNPEEPRSRMYPDRCSFYAVSCNHWAVNGRICKHRRDLQKRNLHFLNRRYDIEQA